jgi:salicylate hydroxylase
MTYPEDNSRSGGNTMHAIVAGAGIGGLSAAIALANGGNAVTVFEQAAEISEVGAGLQLSPNATRVLASLGVLPNIAEAATEIRSIELHDARNCAQLLSLRTSDVAKRTGFPFLAVHRADLQAALYEMAKRTPGISIKTGWQLSAVQQDFDKVSVRFRCNGNEQETGGAILLGADGVWSPTREFVAWSAKPNHSGYDAWRATCEIGNLPPLLAKLCADKRIGAFLSPDAHLVAYPIRHAKLVNLVMVTRGPDMAKGWDHPGKPDLFSKALKRFDLQLRGFLSSMDSWRMWPLHECDPAAAWADGRVALIGDAAHAMTPFAAQGACMAIEDSAVLAACIKASPDDPAFALKRYEALRKPRVAKVVSRGRINRFAYHVSGPVAVARNTVFKLRGQALIRELDWLYGFDALNLESAT